jgi:hypothetical protein
MQLLFHKIHLSKISNQKVNAAHARRFCSLSQLNFNFKCIDKLTDRGGVQSLKFYKKSYLI